MATDVFKTSFNQLLGYHPNIIHFEQNRKLTITFQRALEVVENKVSQAFVIAQVVCDGFCSFHYLHVQKPRYS
jgi:hypothetical protein